MEVDERAMVDPSRGLSTAEVEERRRRGAVNDVPAAPTRTVAQIVRANVFTRFNALLGAMLALILLVGGPYQDALFGVVLVANALIGIVQEIRAKRTLDRLTLLTAPRAHVVRDGSVRDGSVREVPVGEVVLDDVLDAPAGAQIVVDGEVVRADGFEVDESLLTGESDPVRKQPGDPVLSGAFVAAGSGRYRATAVGADAYATRIAQDARRFTLTHSELRDGIDRILLYVTWAIVPTAVLLFVSQYRVHDSWRDAVSGAVAGTVAMVPEGLVLLTSLAFAVAVVRLARQRVLIQELPAVEGLARADVVCIDKTGTLTEGRLGIVRVDRVSQTDPGPALAALAAADPAPNATMRALAEAYPPAADGWRPDGGVPFSSARKWSAGVVRRQRDVGARRTRRARGTRRAPRPPRRRGRGRQPRAAALAGRVDPRRRAPRGPRAGGSDRPGRSRPRRRRGDARVLRRAGRHREGAFGRPSGDRRVDRRVARPRGRRAAGRRHPAAGRSGGDRLRRSRHTPCTGACPRSRSARWWGRCERAVTSSR